MQAYFGFFSPSSFHQAQPAPLASQQGHLHWSLPTPGEIWRPKIRDVEVLLFSAPNYINHQMEKSHDLCKWFRRFCFDQIWICHCVLSMFLVLAKVMSSCEPSFQHKQDPKNWFFLLKLRPKLTISDQLDVWRSRIWRHPPWRFLNADHLRNVLLHLGKSGRQHDANGTFIHPASGNRMNKNKNKRVCDYFPTHYLWFISVLFTAAPSPISLVPMRTKGPGSVVEVDALRGDADPTHHSTMIGCTESPAGKSITCRCMSYWNKGILWLC